MTNHLPSLLRRRASTVPAVIGLLTAFVSPAFCLIWAGRLRSWMLLSIPLTIGLILYASDPNADQRGLKYTLQFIGGVCAYTFTATAKADAKEEMAIRNIDF